MSNVGWNLWVWISSVPLTLTTIISMTTWFKVSSDEYCVLVQDSLGTLICRLVFWCLNHWRHKTHLSSYKTARSRQVFSFHSSFEANSERPKHSTKMHHSVWMVLATLFAGIFGNYLNLYLTKLKWLEGYPNKTTEAYDYIPGFHVYIRFYWICSQM